MSKKLHVKVGDTVMIMSGKDSHKDKDGKRKTGKVLAVSPEKGKIIVEGCNLVKKHVRPLRMGDPGGIIEAEAPMYASKVMHVDPETGGPTRVGYRFENGKKIRYAKVSGKEI